MGTVLGVDAGSATPADAEHLLLGLADRLGAGPGAVLCTHPVRGAEPHYAVSLALPAAPSDAALAAVLPAGGAVAVSTPPGPAAAGARPAGQPDTGQPDTMGARLTGQSDAGRPDAGRPDAGRPDAGRPDIAQPDAGQPDTAGARLAAAAAAAAHAAGTAGRAVRFAGVELLTGTVPIADVLSRTAIDRVLVLGGGSAAGAVLDTRDFVRPEWRDGRLTLLVLPAGPGRVAPFEVPDPTPCCAAHH